jgi:hypothetical protein
MNEICHLFTDCIWQDSVCEHGIQQAIAIEVGQVNIA